MLLTLVVAYVASLLTMSIGFFVARHVRRVDAVDVFWGLTIVAVVLASVVIVPNISVAAYVAAGLVAAWGYRLSSHIAARFRRSQFQDERYTELMAKWPASHRWLQVFVKIFLVQSVLAFVVALPAVFVAESNHFSYLWLVIGAFVWFVGFVFESVADSQLAAFLHDEKNKGKLMTSGLWHYSRHPNYFGEMTMWWGIWLISCGTNFWWIGILGPVTISLLLRYVSGVPLAEKRSESKPGWRDYEKRTSVLLPLPPRK